MTWRTAWFGTSTLLSDRWPAALQVQDLFLEAKGHYRRRGGLPLLVEVGPSLHSRTLSNTCCVRMAITTSDVAWRRVRVVP